MSPRNVFSHAIFAVLIGMAGFAIPPGAAAISSSAEVPSTDEQQPLRTTDIASADSGPTLMTMPSANASPLSASSVDALDLERFAEHPRVASYIRYFQGPGRETMARWLDRGAAYLPMIRDRLAAADLPTDLGYLALIESGFRNTAVSRKGAVGMWQFMPGTARAYGLRVDSRVDERRDPIKATDAAVRHLQDLRDQFGSIYLAAAAFNAGAGRVSRGLEKLRDFDESPFDDPAAPRDSTDLDADFFRLSDARLLAPETVNYVPQLIAAALIAKDPSRYAFDPPTEPAVPLDTLKLHKLAIRTPASRGPLAGIRTAPTVGTARRTQIRSIPRHTARSTPQALLVRVRRGDTVRSLAERFGVAESEMRRVNALPRSYKLRAGQVLRRPQG
jgi:membrane-bound lytic murein transglycosylase D